jgi:DNA transformation protein
MRDDDNEFIAHLLDLLRRWAPVAARRMFGGHGLFRGGIMFGLLHDEIVYFKTDDGNRADYEAAGMAPFRYTRAGKSVALSFHVVPADLLEAGDELAPWAERAYAAALRTRRPPPRRRSRSVAAPDLTGDDAGRRTLEWPDDGGGTGERRG